MISVVTLLVALATTLVHGESKAQVLVSHRGQPLPPGMEAPPFPHFPTTNALPDMDPLVRAAQLRTSASAAPFAFEFSPTPSGLQLQTLTNRQDVQIEVSDIYIRLFFLTQIGTRMCSR